MPVKEDINKQLGNEWVIGMCEAPSKEPAEFCYSFLPCGCTCMAGIQQRQKLLQITGEPYFCCGGLFPFCCLKQPCDPSCVYVEGCCLQPFMYSGNRYIIQTRFGVRNNQCDEMIIWFTVIVSWTICILELLGVDVPDELELAVNLLVNTVYSCMHAQQHAQIKHIESVGYRSPPPQLIVLLPPQQQMMIQSANGGGMMMPSGKQPGGQMMGQPQQVMMMQPQPVYQQQQMVYQQQGFQPQYQQQPFQQQQQARGFRNAAM